MRRTYRKNILRTVRATLGRFLAIFAIVALGVGFLAGLLAATPDMRYSGDRFFDETHMYDLRILSELGLTEEDVEAIRAVEGVGEVMPGYYADVFADTPDGDTVVARFHSVPLEQVEEKEPENYLNRLEVVEGRLPVKEDECVISGGSYLTGSSFEVGDTIELSADNEDLEDTFTRTSFKIVGVVKSSNYFSVEREPANIGSGTVSIVAYTGAQNFAYDVYTEVYASVEGTQEMSCFSDEYKDAVQAVSSRIEAVSGALCQKRYDDVKAQTEQQLADARAQLADAQQDYDDGRAEVAENEEKLADAEAEIEAGEAELAQNKETISGTLTQKQQQLADAEALVIEGKAQLEAARTQLDTASAQLAAGKTALEAAKQQLPALEQAVEQAEAQRPVLESQLSSAKAALEAAEAAVAEKQAGYDEALARRDEAQGEYDAAAAEVARLEQAIKDAKDQGQDTAELETQLAAAKQALEYKQTDLAEKETILSARSAELQTANSQHDAAQAQVTGYETALAALDAAPGQLADAKAQIAQQEKTLAEGEAQLAAGEAEYQKQAAVLREAEKEIASGKTSLSMAPALAQLQMQLAEEQLEEAKAEVTDGKAQLEEAKQQLADGKAELDDAEQQLADGEQALAELEVPEWFLLTRSENVSYASFEMNIEKVDAVAKVFPVFFFLVAALVALTTMTRMVEEDRLQIGTLKALGYGKGSIMAKYLLYALAASVLGSAFGLAVGLTLLPTVIWNAYTMMYELPKLYCLFNARFALFSSLTAIACVLAATLNACWATLQEVPAQLMLPRAPKAGKRIFLEYIPFIWRRMKFTHKVAARNLLRYKKRFFMTVTGIAGCTALLLTGFGLHDSISDIVYKQFGDIFLYDVSITVKDAAKAESGALADVLADGDAVKDALLVHQEKITSHFNGEAFSTYLMVPENSAGFPDFVDLHTRKGGTPVPFSETGVVITEKMAERGGFNIGSQITLENADGDTGTFTVDGIAENYVENYVYLSAETYEHGFGAAPVFNTVLAISADPSGEGRDALSARLLGTDGVSSVSFTSDLKTSFSGMLQKIDIIVVVLIVAAGLLAYVVLYNLTNINIAERVKEIATIKVLGFYDKEVYAYVYRENIVLSLIGTLTGLVLGIFLHMFVIYTVEVDATMFGRSIKFWSYAASAGLTILFSLLVNLAMRRKLRNISMVESMKAPE